MNLKKTQKRGKKSFKEVAILVAVFAAISVLAVTNISAQFVDRAVVDEMNVATAGESLRIEKVTPIEGVVPQVVDPQSIFSNVTTFGGLAGSNGGSGLIVANTITRLMADDVQPRIAAPYSITGYRFNISNLNAVAVSARPRLRFYRNDGAGSGPGTLIGGSTFNAISFAATSVTTFTANPITTPLVVPSGTFIWAGITFDNNSGATGATAVQLDNLGQGLFNPVDRGASADLFFRTTAAGDFFASNPVGGFLSFGGAPVANFGWELLVVGPTPAAATVSGRVLRGKGSGRGISNATVSITDATGETRWARTNTFGYFHFNGVEVGQTYVFNVSAKGYEFSPQVVNVNNDLTNLNFISF